jgi:hypothetical protein
MEGLTLIPKKHFVTISMLTLLLILNLVNAITLRREFSILFNRVAICILLYSGIMGYDSLYITYLDNRIGIYNGLFHSTAITYSFDLFIYIIGTIIYFFTAFYARRIVQPIFPYNRFGPANGVFPKGYVKAYRNAVMCISVTILLYFCTSGTGMYNGLFHSIAISHSFNLFIDIIGAIILLFCPE